MCKQIILQQGEKRSMELAMKNGFCEMNEGEMRELEGGILGVDDAIFWAVVGGAFFAGFAGGIAAGISNKNRE